MSLEDIDPEAVLRLVADIRRSVPFPEMPAASRADGCRVPALDDMDPQTEEDFVWAVVVDEVESLANDLRTCLEQVNRRLAETVRRTLLDAGLPVPPEVTAYLRRTARAGGADDEGREE